ncbi:MAG: hypothetical protein WCI29_12780 [Actinomycetes bacterium]
MDEVLATCQRTWRRLGVPRQAVTEMLDELANDLRAAAEAGVTPQSYVGGDAAGMARAWAAARGLVRPRFHVLGVVLITLLVTVPLMFAASYIYVASTSAYVADLLRPGWDLVQLGPADGVGTIRPRVTFPLWFFLGWYVLAVLVGLGGILLALSAYLRRWADPARLATLKVVAVAVVPSALVAAFAVAGVSKALAGQNGTLAGQVAQYVTFATVFAIGIGATRALVVTALRRRTMSVKGEAIAVV